MNFPSTRKIVFLVITEFVLCLFAASSISIQDDREKAEEIYKMFYKIMSKSIIGDEEAEVALGLIKRAYALFPGNYKYAFSLGYCYKSIEKWDLAEKYFSEALERAPQDKVEDTKYWLDVCSKRNYSKNHEVKYEIKFSLKEPMAKNLDLIINTEKAVLPKILPGEDSTALLAYFQKIEPRLRIIRYGIFFLVGAYSTSELEYHYKMGLADAYRIFTNEYFPTNNIGYLVILISEDPMMLAGISRTIYPRAYISSEEPYMGFFCKNDNLIVATIGGGYGTLLHELMHALMAKNMPSAPFWLQEGMATLYERSAWTTNRLIPLPNWRMDFIISSPVPSLVHLDHIVRKPEYEREDLAVIRLLLLFLERKSLLNRFLQIQGAADNTQKISEILASFGIEYSEENWQEFAQTTITSYRAELGAEPGAPSYRDTKFVQRALNKIMDAGLKEDGIWGSTTKEKVMEFQRRFSLEVDGIVGKHTKEKLEKEFSLKIL